MKRITFSIALGIIYSALSLAPVFAQTDFSPSGDLTLYFSAEQLGAIPDSAEQALSKQIQLQPNQESLNALVKYVSGYLNDRSMHISDALAVGDFALAAKLKSDPINCYVMTQVYQYKKWGVVIKNTMDMNKNLSADIKAKIAALQKLAGTLPR